MDELKLGQFNRISDIENNRGVNFLRNHNINIHYSVPIEESPIPLMSTGFQGYNYLHLAAQNSDLPSIIELINRGANVLQLTAEEGKTPLLLSNTQVHWKHKYVWEMKGKIKDKTVIEILLSAQVRSGNALNVHCIEYRITHLHLASAIDHVDAVEMFLSNGEWVNHAVTFDSIYLPGYTALHFAVHHSSVESARILLKYGADLNLKDANGMSSLHLLLERLLENIDFMTCGKRSCCLQYTEERRSLESIVSIILNTRIEDTIDDTGLTTLHLACLLTDTTTVENYLRSGPNVNASINYNSKLWSGWTALHFAACANLQNVLLLLINGADLLAKNAKDESPLDFCMRRYSHYEIHAILMSKSEFRDIFFNDGVNSLLDTILLMTNCQFVQYIKDVNVSVSANSPLWPGYTLLHLSVSMNEKVFLGENMYKDFYSEEEYKSLPRIYNCSQEEEQSYRKRIATLLLYHCSVDIENADGLTPVQLAFKLHRSSIVEELLNISRNYTNVSYLHIACAVGNLNFVKECIRNRLNVNSPVVSSFEWYATPDGDKMKAPLLRVREKSTALHIAVIFCRKSIVEYLLDHGADTCARDALDLTPIHLCLVYGLEINRDVLIRSNLQESVRDGLSHLHFAANIGDVAAIERLLAFGANINSIFETNNVELSSMFNRFQGFTPLHAATRNRHVYAIRALIRAGADIHVRSRLKRAESSLVTALGCFNDKHVHYFAERLINSDLVVGPIEPNGLTALHFACGRLDLAWMKRLLYRNADPNARILCGGDFKYGNWSGDTPLHVLVEEACWAKEIPWNLMDMVRLLLAYGASVTKIEQKLQTVVHRIYDLLFDCSFINRYHDVKTWPKKKAIFLSVVDMLLQSQGSYAVNPINNNRLSHFHIACARDNVEIVEKFLENSVDINATTNPIVYVGDGGFTPLHFAVKHKAERVARLLIDRGADVKIEDVDGNTPLHIVAREGFVSLELVEMLLRRGADINARNLDGITALTYFLMSVDFTMVQFNFFIANGSIIDLRHVTHRRIGIIGLAMYNAVPNDRLLIFEKMINTYDVKMALINNFNAIQSVVSVKHYGILTHDFYLNVIQQLMEMGCDLDQQDEEGKTSLHHAAKFYNCEAVKALLLLGADVNIVDNRNESPLSIVFARSVKLKDARRTQVSRLLKSHIWRLMFLELDVNPVNRDVIDKTVFSPLRVSSLQKQCEEELKKAKLRRISLFLNFADFLSDSLVCKFLQTTMREWRVVDNYFKDKSEIRQEFPGFSGILLMHYRRVNVKLRALKYMDWE